MEGINLCYNAIENMLSEYEQTLNNENTLDKIKSEIAIDILKEVLIRIDSCKDEAEEREL